MSSKLHNIIVKVYFANKLSIHQYTLVNYWCKLIKNFNCILSGFIHGAGQLYPLGAGQQHQTGPGAKAAHAAKQAPWTEHASSCVTPAAATQAIQAA